MQLTPLDSKPVRALLAVVLGMGIGFSGVALIAAGARILPHHVESASPALAELLRARGATEAEG